MKRTVACLGLLAAILIIAPSCKKVIEQIFPGFDSKVPDIQVTLPVIPFAPPFEISAGTYTVKFNLDSIVKANTSNVFNAGSVSSVKIKEATINVSNADNLSNLGNFEYARIVLSSNTNTNAINVATLNFPDAYTSSVTVTPSDSPELISYLKGDELTYTIYGKARRPTLKALDMTVSITVRVQ
jgi:hypothetical protein